MSEDTQVKAPSGPGLFLPFVLLALGCAVAVFTLLRDARLVAKSLDAQMEQAGLRLQQAGAQGQQVGAARQHYYQLYADLVALAKTDEEAAAIVGKYGIRMNAPPAGQK